MILPHLILLIMRNFADNRCTENQNTVFYVQKRFPKVILSFRYFIYIYIYIYITVTQATDDNMTQAHCMLGNLGYELFKY